MNLAKYRQIIHVLKNKYELDNETYREFLIENFNGIDTSLGLNLDQCDYCIHILNYKYNQDYKYGFDKALEMFGSLEDLFIKKIETKFERRATDLEIDMFSKMDREQQREYINKI